MDVVRRKVAAGSASQRDVLAAEMELAELESLVQDHKDLARLAAARLATLAGLPADTRVGAPGGKSSVGKPGGLSNLLKQAQDRSQELKLASLALEKMELTIRLLKRMTYPDLSSGADSPVAPLASEGVGAFPSKPMVKTDLYLSGKDAYLAELEHRLGALSRAQEAAQAEVSFSVEDARRSLKLAWRSHQLHGLELADKARRSLDLALAAYGQGRATFTDLLESQRRLVHHRLEALKASRDTARAWAMLQDAALLF